jgi:hypothetical protein
VEALLILGSVFLLGVLLGLPGAFERWRTPAPILRSFRLTTLRLSAGEPQYRTLHVEGPPDEAFRKALEEARRLTDGDPEDSGLLVLESLDGSRATYIREPHELAWADRGVVIFGGFTGWRRPMSFIAAIVAALALAFAVVVAVNRTSSHKPQEPQPISTYQLGKAGSTATRCGSPPFRSCPAVRRGGALLRIP